MAQACSAPWVSVKYLWQTTWPSPAAGNLLGFSQGQGQQVDLQHRITLVPSWFEKTKLKQFTYCPAFPVSIPFSVEI